MDITQNRYWPFGEFPPLKREIRFLETAYHAGFKPYMFGSENFGATAQSRGGIVLCRGGQGRHWEVLLGTTERTVLSAHVDDFDCASEAVLRWLRGDEAKEILEQVRDHLVIDKVTAPGFVLHREKQ